MKLSPKQRASIAFLGSILITELVYLLFHHTSLADIMVVTQIVALNIGRIVIGVGLLFITFFMCVSTQLFLEETLFKTPPILLLRWLYFIYTIRIEDIRFIKAKDGNPKHLRIYYYANYNPLYKMYSFNCDSTSFRRNVVAWKLRQFRHKQKNSNFLS